MNLIPASSFRCLLLVVFFSLCSAALSAQTLEELMEQEQYEKLIEQAQKQKELSGREYYLLGRAFFYTENDKEALNAYEKAIKAGYDNADVFYFKGVSYQMMQKYDKAIEALEIAWAKAPQYQHIVAELAFTHYKNDDYKKALMYYEKAAGMEGELESPWYYLAHIPALQENYTAAAPKYEEALEKLTPGEYYYAAAIRDLGILYRYKLNAPGKAAAMYEKAIAAVPDTFLWHEDLHQAYYRAGNYAKGDSLFALMKKAWEEKKLPEELQENGSMFIDEFELEDGVIVKVVKRFRQPEAITDILHVFYFVKNGEIIAKYQTEYNNLMAQMGDEDNGIRFLLCKQDKSSHSTLNAAYGDPVDYVQLKKDVIKAYGGKISVGASSRPGRKR